MPERRIRPQDVEFELGKDAEKAAPVPLERRKARTETQELLAEMMAPSEDVREAIADVMKLQELREKPALSKEEMATLEKAVDGMLAFVESRTDAMREAEKDIEALAASDRLREEAAIDAKRFAALRAEAEELHRLAQATDTLRSLNLAQAVEGRKAFNEGVELGMRIRAARDAICSFQEMRGAVVGLLLRSDQQQIIERCGELIGRLDGDIAHEQRIMTIAGRKQAERIDLAAERITEEIEAPRAARAVSEYPPAEELEAETAMLRTASLDTVVEDVEDIFSGIGMVEIDQPTAERSVAGLESAVGTMEGRTVRAERAITAADWEDAALASKDLHEFSQIISDAVKAHYDGLAAKNADVTGLDYAMLRIQAADDAERVFDGMLELAVERMARAPKEKKADWADVVDRLQRAVSTERASRQAAQGLIETLRASAAE